MARTKTEVTSFANSQVGKKVNAKAGVYNGQCVSLIKALLEFLGVPDPYAARGHAKDVGDTLLRQNIAENGKGWLTVVVNRSMGNIGGVTYGHVWFDLQGAANYEQNGARALHTTKNTRPLSQGQQFINLDKWLKEEDVKTTRENAIRLERIITMNHNPTDKQIKAATGKDLDAYLADRYNDGDFLENKKIVRNKYPAALKEIKELKKQLEEAGNANFIPVGQLYQKKEG